MKALLSNRGALSNILKKASWLGGPQDQGVLRALNQRPRTRPPFSTKGLTFASSFVKRAFTYKCTECGEQSPQWKGRCPSCSGWNTLEKAEVLRETAKSSGGGGGGGAVAAAAAAAVRPLGERIRNAAPTISRPRTGWVSSVSQRPQRLSEVGRNGYGSQWRIPLRGANGAELARVLGGGVVPGSLTLVGGDPGVGKSTLLLQVAAMLGPEPAIGGSDEEDADEEGPPPAGEAVLYVSAEESVEQVGSRAERMGLRGAKHLFLYSATRLVEVLQEIVAMQPRAVIIDSIQTVYLDDVTGSAGSVSQVRECATALLHVAKRQGVPVFLVGHVTKAGDIAGPRVLEHIVDTVVYMEGERHQAFRLVRGIKNRYGPTDEVGVFQMEESGLQAVANPSALFLSDRQMARNASSAVTVAMEGTRPLLMEVQALTSPVHQGPPLRMPNGIHRNRLSLIMAVLTKHVRLRLHSVDCHTNVVGGLTLTEPATDLAVALAVASSYFERPIAQNIAVIGEIGLGGELRPANHIERRVVEAAKLGFTTVIVPATRAPTATGRLAGVNIIPCRTIKDALEAALGPSVTQNRAPHFEQQEEEENGFLG
ncbi:DNA repair protein rada [Coccomyxa subellipsoidea C-169]|uniref:DNA repair protein rada n=1 Tax=Coccomyxa subellipsoidea (strain C-169) TaxID=574566 RepID=I0YJM8_COCSC|nr:DNA repair protein rada [Coccomyxa subellipsoidea C-169]EIE18597.1 DNA repair protein rada [Coccomyxa subellipsoidea C-169]|eukprot:XP_005643141.1 DNA repair protein rada [Coccomyxa subellipsoidea C-169]